MNKKSSLLTAGMLTACLAFFGYGQAQMQPPLAKTLLWKVTGKGLTMASYIFGTMHVLCADSARLSDSVKGILSRCDQVYFEINLNDMNALMNSLKFMRMNDNKKLSDLLSPKDYTKVKDYFDQHPPVLPFGMLERFKPMLVSSLLEEQSMDCKVADGMEMLIMKEVKEKGKPVLGLETVEFQAGLFDSIPYIRQAKDLVNYIDSAVEYSKVTREMTAVYMSQDLEKLDALSVQGDQTMADYMDLLLYDRNRDWVKQIVPELKKKSLLIAVGAAHLPGDQGILNLLKNQGYMLTPMDNDMTPVRHVAAAGQKQQ